MAWRLEVPGPLADRLATAPAEGGPDGAAWLRAVPQLAGEVVRDWDLEPVGPPVSGHCSVVVPVRRPGRAGLDGGGGEPLMLKLGWPHTDAAQEHLALRHWAGDGAVRLVAADPRRGVLLLEALDGGRDLDTLPVEEACAVVGALLARLHRPAPPSLRRLDDVARDRWAPTLRRAGDALPRRLVVRALGLIAELTADPDPARDRLLHTDLHFRNVLAGVREPWLVIDPKPLAGHPGLELHPLLRNRVDELGTASAMRWSVRRRVELVCDVAGIDERAARRWTIVVAALQGLWQARRGDLDGTGFNIALAKALED